MTNRASFTSVAHWLRDINELAVQDCAVLVLANKADVDKSLRTVTTQEGIELAKLHQFNFYEVSAIDNWNIKEAMQTIAGQIY